MQERACQKKGPWLCDRDGKDCAARELTTLMVFRCFVREKQRPVKGYLAGAKYVHKIFAGWDLPTSHCRVFAVGKGIGRPNEKSDVTPREKKRSHEPYFLQKKSYGNSYREKSSRFGNEP